MTTTFETTDVVVATTADDAAVVEAVKAHHAELAGRLHALTERVLATSTTGGAAFEQARTLLLGFCTGDLLPHAGAEEAALYPVAAAGEQARLLVDSMVEEHGVVKRLVQQVGSEAEPVRSAAAAYALRVVFDSHLVSENDLVLPMLAADPGVNLAELLQGMHGLLGGHAAGQPQSGAPCGQEAEPGGDGSCGCGHSGDDAVPELDVRNVPHAIRHATVFGAFDGVLPGNQLVLVAPHDPLPLLKQLSSRAGGLLGVDYLERGPDAWRLLLTRG